MQINEKDLMDAIDTMNQVKVLLWSIEGKEQVESIATLEIIYKKVFDLKWDGSLYRMLTEAKESARTENA